MNLPVTEPKLGQALVVNRRHYIHGPDRELANYEYIGRPHLMSNPYTVKQYGRDKCLELFNNHLRQRMKERHSETMAWLKYKAELIIAGENVHLGCSCKQNRPEDISFLSDPDVPCHGDTVALAIEWMAVKLLENATFDKVVAQPNGNSHKDPEPKPQQPPLTQDAAFVPIPPPPEGQPRYVPFREGDRVCLRVAPSRTYEVLSVAYAPSEIDGFPTPHLKASKEESDVNFHYTLTNGTKHKAFWYHSQLVKI